MADNPEEIRIPIVYVGAEDTPIHYANQFVVQHQQDEFILMVGQISPPILLGTEEERRQQAKQVAYVPVKVVARLAMTRARLVELIKVLQDNLQTFDKSRIPGG